MTKNLFNEKFVGFDTKADEKFVKQIEGLEQHFIEMKYEDDRVNVNNTEVANATMKAITSEIDKFNKELRKKGREDNINLKEGELDDHLEQSNSGVNVSGSATKKQ